MKKLIIDTCIGFECDEAQALAIALYAMTKWKKYSPGIIMSQ